MDTGLKCLFIWGITLKYDFIYTQFEGSSVSINQMVMPCAALFNCLSPFLEWFLQHASVYSHSWCDHVQCWLGTYTRRTQSSGKYYEWLVSWNVTGQFSGDDWWQTGIVATHVYSLHSFSSTLHSPKPGTLCSGFENAEPGFQVWIWLQYNGGMDQWCLCYVVRVLFKKYNSDSS